MPSTNWASSLNLTKHHSTPAKADIKSTNCPGEKSGILELLMNSKIQTQAIQQALAKTQDQEAPKVQKQSRCINYDKNTDLLNKIAKMVQQLSES